MRTRVYYGDTDAGGVAYYANYLRWLEMARWEYVEGFGRSVKDYADEGFVFAVARIEVDYRIPARLGEEVDIETSVARVRRVRFTMRQRVLRVEDGEEMLDALVMLACVTPEGKLIALPDDLAEKLDGMIWRVIS